MVFHNNESFWICCDELMKTHSLTEKIKSASIGSCPEGYNCWIYFIKNDSTGLYKIGITQQIKRRIGELNRQNGGSISFIIAAEIDESCRCTAHHIEKLLHKHYDKNRVISEWFKLSFDEAFEVFVLFNDIDAVDMIETIP